MSSKITAIVALVMSTVLVFVLTMAFITSESWEDFYKTGIITDIAQNSHGVYTLTFADGSEDNFADRYVPTFPLGKEVTIHYRNEIGGLHWIMEPFPQ